MKQSRTQELLNNCIEYLAELWEREPNEEWNYHWKEIVGMTDDEVKEYDLERSDD